MKSSFKIDLEIDKKGNLNPIITIEVGDESLEDFVLKTLLESSKGTLEIQYESTDTPFQKGNESKCVLEFDDKGLTSPCLFSVQPNQKIILKKP